MALSEEARLEGNNREKVEEDNSRSKYEKKIRYLRERIPCHRNICALQIAALDIDGALLEEPAQHCSPKLTLAFLLT